MSYVSILCRELPHRTYYALFIILEVIITVSAIFIWRLIPRESLWDRTANFFLRPRNNSFRGSLLTPWILIILIESLLSNSTAHVKQPHIFNTHVSFLDNLRARRWVLLLAIKATLSLMSIGISTIHTPLQT